MNCSSPSSPLPPTHTLSTTTGDKALKATKNLDGARCVPFTPNASSSNTLATSRLERDFRHWLGRLEVSMAYGPHERGKLDRQHGDWVPESVLEWPQVEFKDVLPGPRQDRARACAIDRSYLAPSDWRKLWERAQSERGRLLVLSALRETLGTLNKPSPERPSSEDATAYRVKKPGRKSTRTNHVEEAQRAVAFQLGVEVQELLRLNQAGERTGDRVYAAVVVTVREHKKHPMNALAAAIERSDRQFKRDRDAMSVLEPPSLIR